MAKYTRRAFLGATAGATSLAGVAGCIDDTGSASGATETADGRPVARSSFFVFGDFAAAVAGDRARAETLVPLGQHGHGWEPGPQVRRDVADADLFVYVREGFQPWADDMVADVGADGSDVVTVAAGSDVDLIAAGHGDAHDEQHGDGSHGGGHTDAAHRGSHTETDHDGEGHHGDHDGAGHGGTDHGESHTEGHDHESGADPHFWLDPLRAKTAVETISEGFADVDPDNTQRYAENAAAYGEQLDALDEAFESTLAEASRSVVLVAGHGAFGYLEDRYGVETVSLTGLSPDDRPTPKDVERAQAVIDEHDLEYVCADPLESQRAAEELVAETDARTVLPLTALPGRRESWAEKGWGYVDVMESVNLSTLERALGAE